MAKKAGAGAKLLPETRLAVLLGVSRPTIRKAVDELVRSGVLTRQSRRGVYVNDSRAALRLEVGFLCRFRALTHYPFEMLLRSRAESEATRRGHRFIPIAPDDVGQMQQALAQVEALLLRERIDHTLLPPNLPIAILYGGDHYVPNATYVGVDDYLAGVTAARYLIALGHRRLAYIGHMQPQRGRHRWQEERYHGVCDAAAAGELPRPPFINSEGEPISPSLLAPVVESDITGVVCANDETAMPVISCLHRMGKQVPEDISVIGFDDVAAAASFVPPLTTMGSPVGRVVATALDELEQRVRDPERALPRKIILPMTLVERQSCAPPCS